MTILRSGSASDVGRVRAVNEDQAFESLTLFAVADGMGGHAGGDVAAQTAIDALAQRFGVQPSPNGLVQAVRDANTAVWEKSNSDPDLRGMGTTMTAIGLVNTGAGDHLVLVNVGDSRAYRLRQSSLEQLTVDHSVAEELVARGELTQAQADVHPHRHILTRALGVGPEVDVDVWEVAPHQGDRLLLCSDGLSNELSRDRILEVLSANPDPQEAAEALVARANALGGNDNITVVVVDVLVAEDEEGTEASTGERGAVGAGAVAGAATAGALAGTATGAVSAAGAAGGPGTDGGTTGLVGAEPQDAGARAGVVTLSSTTIPPSTDLAPSTSVPTGALGSPPPAAEPAGRRRRRDRGPRKPRRITFRVLLFVVLLAGLAYGAYYLVRWYSNSSYYVALVYNPSLATCTQPAAPSNAACREVVIYQGRPGGVFGIKPKIVVRYPGVTLDKIPPSAIPVGVPNVQSHVEESSVNAARAYVHGLQCAANAISPANTPTFPTVTDCPITVVPPTTTTTTRPGGSTAPGQTTTTRPGATTTTAHALGALRPAHTGTPV